MIIFPGDTIQTASSHVNENLLSRTWLFGERLRLTIRVEYSGPSRNDGRVSEFRMTYSHDARMSVVDGATAA